MLDKRKNIKIDSKNWNDFVPLNEIQKSNKSVEVEVPKEYLDKLNFSNRYIKDNITSDAEINIDEEHFEISGTTKYKLKK